jgi:hypothetical protein
VTSGEKVSTVRHRPAWAPDAIDLERPAAARMYDYYLGGSHNFAADRTLAEENKRVWPDVAHIARANRAFLGRAVGYLSSQGVDQFLDLGSGIPTAGNVHDIAQAVNPDARTVYVDADHVAVAHAASLLAEVANAVIVHADLRDAAAVLGDPAVVSLLDFDRPVGVLMFSVLHFVVPADDPAAIVAAYRAATAPGSYLAVSHATNDYRPDRAKATEDIYSHASHQMIFRSRGQIAELMHGYELVPPGLVDMIHWRPDPAETDPDPLGGDVTRYSGLAAVGLRA